MAISETARRNHEELFPGHTSKLAVTDPELIELFDNFAFDEVLRHGNLDARTRLSPLFAALNADLNDSLDGVRDSPNQPLEDEPQRVKDDLNAIKKHEGRS